MKATSHPPTKKYTKRSPIMRFIQKLNIQPGKDACWLYTGAVSPSGYGVFHSDKSIAAHRYAHLAFIGPIPEGKVVMHTCNNKLCMLHLKAGTSQENSADAKKDGLLDAPRRKYRKATADEIEAIRQQAKVQSICSLAKAFDRSVPYVSRVVSGQLHANLLKPKKIIPLPKKPVAAPTIAMDQAAA